MPTIKTIYTANPIFFPVGINPATTRPRVRLLGGGDGGPAGPGGYDGGRGGHGSVLFEEYIP